MIARFTTIATEPEADAEWFADHGLRRFRVRPASGGCMIVDRSGDKQPLPMPMRPALRDADDEILAVIFSAHRQVAAANS